VSIAKKGRYRSSEGANFEREGIKKTRVLRERATNNGMVFIKRQKTSMDLDVWDERQSCWEKWTVECLESIALSKSSARPSEKTSDLFEGASS